MHLVTHAWLGWLVAESAELERRDRALVLAAGVVPDLDALAILGGAEAYRTWHHVILHHGLAAMAYAALVVALGRRRFLAAALALLGFHLHLLCDFVGSAGPGGSRWPIPYFVPFDFRELTCPFQWELRSWQNVVITLLVLGANIRLGVRRGRTIVEPFSLRADAAVVQVLRRRWPLRRTAEVDSTSASPREKPPSGSS